MAAELGCDHCEIGGILLDEFESQAIDSGNRAAGVDQRGISAACDRPGSMEARYAVRRGHAPVGRNGESDDVSVEAETSRRATPEYSGHVLNVCATVLCHHL